MAGITNRRCYIAWNGHLDGLADRFPFGDNFVRSRLPKRHCLLLRLARFEPRVRDRHRPRRRVGAINTVRVEVEVVQCRIADKTNVDPPQRSLQPDFPMLAL